MRETARFAELKRHAKQTSIYQQRFAIGEMYDTNFQGIDEKQKIPVSDQSRLKDGMCAGVTLKWLQEKLGGSNSVFRRSAKDFVHSPTLAQITNLRISAAVAQIDHDKNMISLVELLERNHVTATPMKEYKNKDRGPAPEHMAYTDIPINFVRICRDMQKGSGVLMRTTIKDKSGNTGHHATAIYKSRGGSLHFFDPNAGSYKIKNPAEFIKAWVETYPKQDRVISMNHTEDGFFECMAKDELIRQFREGASCSSIEALIPSQTEHVPS